MLEMDSVREEFAKDHKLAAGVPAPARALVLLRLEHGVERALGRHAHSGGWHAEERRVDGRLARVEAQPERGHGGTGAQASRDKPGEL